MPDENINQLIVQAEELVIQGEYRNAETHASDVLRHPALTAAEQARLYNVLAECAWRTSQLPEAATWSDKAMDSAKEADDQSQQAHALVNKATVHRERSLYAEALDLYHMAYETFRVLEVPIDVARAQMNMGNVLRQLLQYDDAAEYLQSAFELFSQHGQFQDAARTLNLIGLVCDERQMPQQALQYYQQALELFAGGQDTRGKDFSMAWLFKNIGGMHMALQHFDESFDYYVRSLELFERIGNRLGAAAVCASLGSLFADIRWASHDDLKAETLLAEATDVLAELGDKHERAKCHRSLATLFERQHRWEECSRHFMQFYELMQEVQSDVAKKRAAAEAYERRIAELRTEQEVAARYTETIRKQLEIIQRDLRTAERIQQSILPDINEEADAWKDTWTLSAKMVAARSVGGDFYDVFSIDEHRFGVVIADVSGKGMPAALFMVVSRTMLKLQAQTGADPGEVLTQVNAMLHKENVMSMFVTLFYAVFDTRSGMVHFANAGHNPPFIARSAGAVDRVDNGGGIILGIDAKASYQTEEIQLKKGDTMFFYTDGVTEAMNPERELFGEERLEPWLQVLAASSSLSEDVQVLLNTLTDFSGAAGQTDDITMVLVRRLT